MFPESSIAAATNLASVTVDVTKEQCHDAYAYMPDLAGYGLTVFRWIMRENAFYSILLSII